MRKEFEIAVKAAGKKIQKRLGLSQTWVDLIFLKQDPFSQIKEISLMDFTYGLDLSEEEKSILSKASKKLMEDGYLD